MADGTEANGAGRGPVGHVVDLLVFAPLGLLAESHTIVPKLAESGRQHVDSRVQLARMVGQFAVQQGRHQAARVVAGWRAEGNGEETAPAPTPEPVVFEDDDAAIGGPAPLRPGADDGGIT